MSRVAKIYPHIIKVGLAKPVNQRGRHARHTNGQPCGLRRVMDKVVALAFMPPNEISKNLEMQSYLTFINNLKFLLWGVVAPNQDRSGPFLTGRIQILNQICATGSGSGSLHYITKSSVAEPFKNITYQQQWYIPTVPVPVHISVLPIL
jgi:hypothetical protein